ncbi:hypothetical protein MJO29_009043 [Puccinia striiformis f. sp. tritici]|uniref:DUF5745 domain-containing protein n=2 Tax=Puccinia striiformis TaxID=27350 RepID=A0A2S4VZ65_9BASI|nr:uncharacterized protein Pst134EA_031763 [Puccinia striiformis f. sp. tritici]KAH9442606.1 hypothetical protein Pst134EA_031763 [Puccinia striiformis f. sp. tritici]KAI7950369.1 hypothetical protein MJO29_009043 [Puccinia striiformis f. sp. tritici]KAI9625952.1 hypothetical protein KEM48_010652 [Puccinia striiformis f. sp. tritici PST-130]POW14814.1 hypothetical protein PSTT_02698 [Puccinia striiformis]
MRPDQHKQNSRMDKGKAKELDQGEVLARLNKLLEVLLIPISIPELSVITPSLLLAVLESILEQRFSELDDATRTSRSSSSRAKCLKIMINTLGQHLEPGLDHWSPNAINLPGLVQGDLNELSKLIDGLLKLSVYSNKVVLYNQRNTGQQSLSRRQHPGRPSKELISEDRERGSQRLPTTRQARASRISSLNSSSSSLYIQPSKIPFDGLFSPGGPPLDQSSRNLASSTTSSHSLLNRSINSQRHNEDPLSGQISNPPTLRNLLGPLHAQMINSKRPHTPRTAHRVMVDKLRNEDAHEDTEEQILNHDTDGWISAKTEAEENEESCIEESRFQYTKGPSLMTLDGIEPDDPFVSMETRRALESQILQNQTTTSFDLTRLAVADSESFNKSSQSFPKTHSRSCPPERKHGSDILNNTWSTSASSVISNHSYQLAKNPNEASSQSSQGHEYHQDQSFTPSARSSPRPEEQVEDAISSFGGSVQSTCKDDRLTDCGFGRPTDSIKMGSREHSLQIPYPTSIPLPASPSQTDLSSSGHHHHHPLKVLLASEGVKLDLVVSDVKSYEESKQERSNIEGWGWMDLSKLAQESEKLQQLGASMKIDNNINNHQINNHFDLLRSRKLELLRLLNQAYKQNKSCDRSENLTTLETEMTGTREAKPSIRTIEQQNENIRIRVNRQPIETDNTHHLNKPTKEYIVLNKFHHVRSLDLGGTTYQSDRNLQFSLAYNQVHDLDYFDDRDELIDDII